MIFDDLAASLVLLDARSAGFEALRVEGFTIGYSNLLSRVYLVFWVLSYLGFGWNDPRGHLAGKSWVGVRDYRPDSLEAFY